VVVLLITNWSETNVYVSVGRTESVTKLYLLFLTAPSQFMIYSQKNLTVRLLPSPTGCLEAVLPIQGLKGVKAIDFDPVQKFLYWVRIKGVVVVHN
jgi:hypothetical protein